MQTIKMFGTKIHNLTLEEVSVILKNYLKGSSLKTVYTPNTEIIMAIKESESLRSLINDGDLIIPDGIGLIYASRLRKNPLKERVTGFDTTIKLLEIADKYKYRLYLLGGREGVAKDASKNIKKNYEGVQIAGFHHGYFKGSHRGIKDSQEERLIINEINQSEPDIIFVGLGFPRQELWIDTNKNKLKGKVIIGNGGVMDILSGKSKRAPFLFQKLYLEWFYRLLQEPSRIKRQMALPKFLLHVLFDKKMMD